MRFARKRKSMSARAVSLLADQSESYVGKLEKGEIAEPSLRAFAKIVRVLQMSPGEVWVVVMHEASTQPFLSHPPRRVGQA